MTRIIVVSAFRGGVGKSTVAANLAALLAVDGMRVAVADIDFQSSGLHLHFGVEDAEIEHMLNDYLLNDKRIQDVAMDITKRLEVDDTTGRLYLLASSMDWDALKRIRQVGYDPHLLNDGLCELLDHFDLDVLFLKARHGMSDQILLSIALSDLLLVVMRPDAQDYQGIDILIGAARALNVPDMKVIVNEVPLVYNPLQVKAEIERAYGCEVATVLPYSDAIAALAQGDGLFAIRNPDHPVTVALKAALSHLM